MGLRPVAVGRGSKPEPGSLSVESTERLHHVTGNSLDLDQTAGFHNLFARALLNISFQISDFRSLTSVCASS
jgi:hypothetical protein